MHYVRHHGFCRHGRLGDNRSFHRHGPSCHRHGGSCLGQLCNRVSYRHGGSCRDHRDRQLCNNMNARHHDRNNFLC